MCDIFYIAYLGVRYEIYTLAFPFDLRCQSGIYIYIYYIGFVGTLRQHIILHTVWHKILTVENFDESGLGKV